MSRCNFCMLQDFQKVAARAGGEVVLEPRPSGFAPDGVDVFIYYPSPEEGVDQPTWCAWLMKLPDKCAC